MDIILDLIHHIIQAKTKGKEKEKITICSYNVFFKMFQHVEKGGKCNNVSDKLQEYTLCAKNMAGLIDNNPHDILCIMEGVNDISSNSDGNNSLEYHSTKYNRRNRITNNILKVRNTQIEIIDGEKTEISLYVYFNCKQFVLEKYCPVFMTTGRPTQSDGDPGRPVTILFFEDFTLIALHVVDVDIENLLKNMIFDLLDKIGDQAYYKDSMGPFEIIDDDWKKEDGLFELANIEMKNVSAPLYLKKMNIAKNDFYFRDTIIQRLVTKKIIICGDFNTNNVEKIGNPLQHLPIPLKKTFVGETIGQSHYHIGSIDHILESMYDERKFISSPVIFPEGNYADWSKKTGIDQRSDHSMIVRDVTMNDPPHAYFFDFDGVIHTQVGPPNSNGRVHPHKWNNYTKNDFFDYNVAQFVKSTKNGLARIITHRDEDSLNSAKKDLKTHILKKYSIDVNMDAGICASVDVTAPKILNVLDEISNIIKKRPEIIHFNFIDDSPEIVESFDLHLTQIIYGNKNYQKYVNSYTKKNNIHYSKIQNHEATNLLEEGKISLTIWQAFPKKQYNAVHCTFPIFRNIFN
jgi:hypothetical protein